MLDRPGKDRPTIDREHRTGEFDVESFGRIGRRVRNSASRRIVRRRCRRFSAARRRLARGLLHSGSRSRRCRGRRSRRWSRPARRKRSAARHPNTPRGRRHWGRAAMRRARTCRATSFADRQGEVVASGRRRYTRFPRATLVTRGLFVRGSIVRGKTMFAEMLKPGRSDLIQTVGSNSSMTRGWPTSCVRFNFVPPSAEIRNHSQLFAGMGVAGSLMIENFIAHVAAGFAPRNFRPLESLVPCRLPERQTAPPRKRRES